MEQISFPNLSAITLARSTAPPFPSKMLPDTHHDGDKGDLRFWKIAQCQSTDGNADAAGAPNGLVGRTRRVFLSSRNVSVQADTRCAFDRS